MLGVSTFALMLGEGVDFNNSIAADYNIAANVACTVQPALLTGIILVGIILGFSLFFFRKNKKTLAKIIIGFLFLFGFSVVLGYWNNNKVIAQSAGASLRAFPDDYGPNSYPYRYPSYSCPSIIDTYVDSWKSNLLLLSLISVSTFVTLTALSFGAKKIRSKADEPSNTVGTWDYPEEDDTKSTDDTPPKPNE